VSTSVEQPPLKYKFAEAAEVNEEDLNIILELDDNLTISTNGIAVKQQINLILLILIL
jgi:hypothetical protein